MSEKQNYIDLKTNGRLFPLWIMKNMKQYQLEKFDTDPNNDPCEKKQKDTVIKLKKYQTFLGAILSYKSLQRNALVYHGLGSGKTAAAINVYNVLYNYNPLWNVFIIIPASLKDATWLVDLKKFLPKEDYDERMSNIKFIHYNAPNADKVFLTAIKNSDTTKKNIYIFDEAHNFIRNVYSNIVTKSGKRALTIYDYIIQEKKDNDDTRVILLSGTPAINNPFELAILFNLLRPDIFPKTESKFKETYIVNDVNNNEILNPKTKNMFQRRILGLVSYYIGANPREFASKKVEVKTIEMSKYQEDMYSHFEYVEDQLERQSSNSTVYKTYTRQSSNFVFPVMGAMNGENRPRPNKFKLSEREAEKIIMGKVDSVIASKKEVDITSVQKNINMYINAVKSYTTALKNHFDNLAKDKTGDRTLKNDIEIFKNKYKYKFKTFWKEHKNKSKLLTALYDSSCKFTALIFYSMRSKGPFIIFSNFVKMEGLEIIKLYLNYFGYKSHRDKSSDDYLRYTEFHGDVLYDERRENLAKFNKSSNKYGQDIKIVLISPAGSEGISLKNIRQIHIADPHWTEIRIIQLFGRGLRMCSHADLPMNERHVDIFRYHAVKSVSKKLSTDEKIYKLAHVKEKLIDTFLLSVKEAAMDCELFKNHNMDQQKYTCFKFNNQTYFDKLIGPAYKSNIHYDEKINNGLNSINSAVVQIKTYKIKAIVKNENDELSEINEYWYNPKSGIVYDIDLDFPIGKVSKTNNIVDKVDTNVYIIDTTIDIPLIKQK